MLKYINMGVGIFSTDNQQCVYTKQDEGPAGKVSLSLKHKNTVYLALVLVHMHLFETEEDALIY